MATTLGRSIARWSLTSFVTALCVAGVGSAQAASYYRDTMCVEPKLRELDSDAVKKVEVLIEKASASPLGIAGTFVTVFLRGASLADLDHGLAAASALTKHVGGNERARTWPIDLKFLAYQEQPCPSSHVLVEVSVLLNEQPLVDQKR